MANEFSGSTVIGRPIDEVFGFLADGTNDPKFSPRVQDIRKTTHGPIAVGTVFESKVKDAGMTTRRQFELTAFEAPAKIRWAERSKNMITVPDGGYDLEKVTRHPDQGHDSQHIRGPRPRQADRRLRAQDRRQGRAGVRAADQIGR